MPLSTSPNKKVFVSELSRVIFTAIFIIIAGGVLALLFDARVLAWVFGVVTLIVAAAALLYAPLRGAALVFGVWCAYGVAFGLRALQVMPLWAIILICVFITACGTYLWSVGREHTATDAFILFFLEIECVALLFFSPAPFLVNASLCVVWAWCIGALLTHARAHTLTARRVVAQLIGAAVIGALFFVAFPWTL